MDPGRQAPTLEPSAGTMTMEDQMAHGGTGGPAYPRLCFNCDNEWVGALDETCPKCHGGIDEFVERVTGDRPPEGGKFRRWTVSELLASDLTYQWDATGFLVRPTYGMDSGEMKTLKSYFGLARAIGLAAGVPILGYWHVPERRRVLYYVAEGGRIPFTRRLIRMCEAHGVDVADLDGWLEPIFDAGPLDGSEFRGTLRAHLADYQPALVHLDPLYPFQPITVSSNQYTQVGLMLNEVQAICAEHEATLWITAHMNQSGAGFDLKRISGAGLGEWGDSWCLLKHRTDPEVGAGKFRLAVDLGSRQWGGGTFEVDFDIGSFDPESGTHDGTISVKVRPAGDGERNDKDITKRLAARKAILKVLRHARRPLTQTEIEDRAVGAAKTVVRGELSVMVDEGLVAQNGVRKPESGGREAPLYVLGDVVDE